MTATAAFSEKHGLALVPAVPKEGPFPEVGLHDPPMDWDGFLELARQLGARALYVDTEHFYPDEYEEWELSPLLLGFEGRVCRIEAAFVVGGVVHRREELVDWWGEWEGEKDDADLRPGVAVVPAARLSEVPERPTEVPSWLHQESAPRLSDAEIKRRGDRLVETLLAKPEFRAGRRADRVRIAEAALPDDADRRLLWGAGYRAADRSEEITKEKYASIGDQYAALAADLLQDAGYRAAVSAGARKQAAERFLAAWADGWSPPALVRDELYAWSQRLAKAGGSHR